MRHDRRTFLLMAGVSAVHGPAARLANALRAGKVLAPHPSWDCGMPAGIPNPESGDLIFEVQMKLDGRTKTLTVRVYDVTKVAIPADSAGAIRIAKPAGAPPQPWDYRKKARVRSRGQELIVESVGLRPSQLVGASMYESAT